jgi:ectoine hydroxylase-related dioxygenase (phytanoyl-CoA dioxygenase family)
VDALAHLTSLVAADVCAGWLAVIDRRYAAAGVVERKDPDFSAHSSSLRLAAVPEVSLEGVRLAVCPGELLPWCEQVLGARVACDADQCWVRRQYAPANYPPLHAPHGWHQDGALRFDFLAHSGQPFPPDAVLEMITCWIPLTPCGVEAPGLELVTRPPEGLLRPADLTDERVRERFVPDECWRPVLEPGDALLFRGDILHRTHVTPAMTKDRTSIELRFFPADDVPARLKGDRFVPLV